MGLTIASSFLLVIAVQCVARGTYALTAPVICDPRKAQIPNPNDRYSFYKCDAAGNPILFQCAPGTWFNPRLEVCDWDTGFNDQQNGGNTWETTTPRATPDFAQGGNWWKPSPTASNPSSPPTNEGNNNKEPGSGVQPRPHGECDPSGPFFYQNTEDCSKFFTCQGRRLIPSACPAKMYFNPQRYRCEATVPRGCKVVQSTAPAG